MRHRLFGQPAPVEHRHDLVADLEPLQAGSASITTPDASVPGANGSGGLRWYLPAITRVVAKLTPAAWILMRTWPALRAGRSTSSSRRSSGSPHWRQIIAFM